ncbi:hypothetical protein N9539_06820 [Amylibacter sp.]|nr:hypothetical protein [Amylibacter sp.]
MKVIGHGLIASVFRGKDYGKDVIIFASGVSKSRENSFYNFDKERVLLNNTLAQNKKLVYFSTCSAGASPGITSPYIAHKLKMEKLVLESSSNIIIRLPQVVGKSRNSSTLVNFFAKNIYRMEPFEIEVNTVRNIIDIDDVRLITEYILEKNEFGKIHDCSLPISFSVLRIVKQLEIILNIKGLYTEKLGEPATYQPSEIIFKAVRDGRLEVSDSYLYDILSKHYSAFSSWVDDLV